MKIVSIGGGTGLSTLLRGLKRYVVDEHRPAMAAGDLDVTDLTAIVTVSDDGGSSGRLRREFRVLPPGDIRNCMVALSEDEALLSRLFQFRFAAGRGLKGHSFGNLFLTALAGVTGDFQEAVRVCSEVLAIRGRIFPSTMSEVRLEAELENGRTVRGETKISRSKRRIARVRLVPPQCRPLPQTLAAIQQADVITLGPGSLFTSLIPNLLVQDVAETIASSRASKIYIGNLMTQPGETTGFSASDHIRTIYDHCGKPVFDYVLLNSAPILPRLERQYGAQESKPVVNDVPEIQKLSVRAVMEDLLSADWSAAPKNRVRHDLERVAAAVVAIGAAHTRQHLFADATQAGVKRPRRKTSVAASASSEAVSLPAPL